MYKREKMKVMRRNWKPQQHRISWKLSTEVRNKVLFKVHFKYISVWGWHASCTVICKKESSNSPYKSSPDSKVHLCDVQSI